MDNRGPNYMNNYFKRTMQLFHSNNFLLPIRSANGNFLDFKVLHTLFQFRFVDLPICSLTQFSDKFCSNWRYFAVFQYLDTIFKPGSMELKHHSEKLKFKYALLNCPFNSC